MFRSVSNLEFSIAGAHKSSRRDKSSAVSATNLLNGLITFKASKMRLDDALQRIDKHREDLEQLGVRRLSVYGSVARDEAREDSDVDLLVEFDRPVGFFHFFRVKSYLEEILDAHVDLAEPTALHPALRDEILAHAIPAA